MEERSPILVAAPSKLSKASTIDFKSETSKPTCCKAAAMREAESTPVFPKV